MQTDIFYETHLLIYIQINALRLDGWLCPGSYSRQAFRNAGQPAGLRLNTGVHHE